MGEAPENFFGMTDDQKLEALGGELAARRLAELERAAPLTSFTRDDLMSVHVYLVQDIYPWAVSFAPQRSVPWAWRCAVPSSWTGNLTGCSVT